jgi:hypothetical protein
MVRGGYAEPRDEDLRASFVGFVITHLDCHDVLESRKEEMSCRSSWINVPFANQRDCQQSDVVSEVGGVECFEVGEVECFDAEKG